MTTALRKLPVLACLLGPFFVPMGCPAEDLGLHLPRGGPDSISQEDIQRDVWLMTSQETNPATNHPDAGGPVSGDSLRFAAGLEHRLAEMHLLPAFGDSYRQTTTRAWNVCGRRDGLSSSTLMLLALNSGSGNIPDAAATAMLISLAKGTDVTDRPEQTMIFCGVSPGAGRELLEERPPLPWKQVTQTLVLGPQGGDKMFMSQSTFGSRPSSLATSAPGVARYEELEFWRLEQQTRSLLQSFLATGSGR